jgi:hypothetical protein
VKLDKDSHLLWACSEKVHHAVDVASDGTIYALAHEFVEMPPSAMPNLPVPYLADYLLVISPDGHVQKRIALLNAFLDSPYSLTLSGIRKLSSTGRGQGKLLRETKGDVMHCNSVKILSRDLAPRFPLFKAGQVLLSFRSLSTLAMLDPASGKLVWAAQGPWRGQHEAQFLSNGRLLLFDNLGGQLIEEEHRTASDTDGGARVLEYDPVTQAMPWSYTDEDSPTFRAVTRGGTQRLPNGNTLLVDPNGGRILEVTRDKHLVWEYSAPSAIRKHNEAITSAHRYAAKELKFLSASARPRP